jgi:hypothetical protein
MPAPFIAATAPVPASSASVAPAALSGITTIDDKVRIDVEIEAYEQLRQALGRISRQVSASLSCPATLAIVDGDVAQGLDLIAALPTQLRLLQAAFACVEQGAAAAFSSLSGADSMWTGANLAAALDLLSAFRQDTAFLGREVVIAPFGLAAAAAEALGGTSRRVLHPGLTVPGSGGSLEPAFFADIAKVLEARNAAHAAYLRLASRVQSMAPGDRQRSAANAMLDQVRAQFDSADAVFRALDDLLTRSDPPSAVPALQCMIAADRLLSAVQSASTECVVFLHLRVLASGGSYRITRSLLQTMFTGDGATYNAGVVVGWALLDRSGTVKASGIVGRKSPFRRLASIDWRALASMLLVLVIALLAARYLFNLVFAVRGCEGT